MNEINSNEQKGTNEELLENTVEDTEIEDIDETEGDLEPTDEDVLNALENPTEAIQNKLNELIQIAVKKALATATPKKRVIKTEPITKEQFAKMSYAQREKLFNENRTLYDTLNK